MNNESSPISTLDLRPSERRFVVAMQQLGYGRFESLQIRCGEFILDPWPTTIRSIKFGNTTPHRSGDKSVEFALKGADCRVVPPCAQHEQRLHSSTGNPRRSAVLHGDGSA
jgi:hypothetical protein